MLIFEKNGWRVYQHQYLNVFNITKWMEGDDPRSYGRKWDYFTVAQVTSIEGVRNYLRENM